LNAEQLPEEGKAAFHQKSLRNWCIPVHITLLLKQVARNKTIHKKPCVFRMGADSLRNGI
jgi:hypothetical protein